MTKRAVTALLLMGVFLLTSGSLAYSQDKHRLKPGAKGKICLKCHVAFEDRLKLPFVHTPVKSGDCSDCHNPHTSSTGKLLASEPNRICFSCHGGMVPSGARSAHKVVVDGNCVKCHDPHAARNRNNLLLAGNELCFSCHKDLGTAIAMVKFKHNPVEKGCLNCHDPHASAKAPALLKSDVPALCTNCHKPTTAAFGKQHLDYPVAKGRCTSCHDPHGSSRRGMFLGEVHAPVVNKMCSQCHLGPSSPDALQVKRPGYELCRACHSNMVNETFARNRIHWPVLDKTGCQNCHSPHASREKRLLNRGMKALCGQCHPDAIQRQEKSLQKHKPVADGNCTACHMPHSSNNVFLLDNTSTINLCGTCHNWQKHSTHPIGEKIRDQRNKNLTLDCLSCHRSHGTAFKLFTYYNPKMDLCVQCHEEYRR